MQYRREIDGLRSLAVLPVILFHAGASIFSGGFVGVDIFFVISGYLITSIIVDDRLQGTFTLANFYEITLLPAQGRALQHAESVCVGGGDAVGQMADLLGAYGFTDREQADFVAGWEHDLPWRASYRVYPQRSVEAVVRVDIQPALPLERLWLLVEDGAGCAPASALPPVAQPLVRAGAHAVEWGVVLRGLR